MFFSFDAIFNIDPCSFLSAFGALWCSSADVILNLDPCSFLFELQHEWATSCENGVYWFRKLRAPPTARLTYCFQVEANGIDSDDHVSLDVRFMCI